MLLLANVACLSFGDEWVKKADMNIPRKLFAVATLNGKIYVFGGNVSCSDFSLSSVEEYDPKIDKWTLKDNMPIAKSYICSSVHNGKIYIFGGWDGSKSTSDVYAYNPLDDSWEKSMICQCREILDQL